MNPVSDFGSMAFVWLDLNFKVIAANDHMYVFPFFRDGADSRSLHEGFELLDKDGRSFEWQSWMEAELGKGSGKWTGRIRSRDPEKPAVHDCRISVMRSDGSAPSGFMLEFGMPSAVPDHEAAVDKMDRSIVFLSPEGDVTYMNGRAAERSLERSADMMGRPVWDGLNWKNLREERESLIRLFRLAVQSGDKQSMILRQGRRFSTPERSIVHITMTPVGSGNGSVSQVVMEEWYIPLGVQMEIRSRMTESVFRSYLDQSPLPAWMVDVQGKLIAASRSYTELFSIGGDDIGKDMMQLVPSRFVMQYTKHHEKVLSNGEHLHVMENWMGQDGRVLTYIVHKFPIRTGHAITMLGAIAFEVTEKLRMEEEFKESHERFALAGEATQDLVWDWDINSDSVRTQAGQEVSWTDGETQVYSSMMFFGKMHPEDRERVEALVKNALADRNVERIHGVYRFRVNGGSYVPIMDRARILRDEHGRPYRVVGSAMRLTGELQRAMRPVPMKEEKTNPMANAIGTGKDMKWTGEEGLEYAIRRALAESDPAGSIVTGLSITGMDKPIMKGFDVKPLLNVVGHFLDTIESSNPVRNLSVYIWSEGNKVWLRAAHDGSGDWESVMREWGREMDASGSFEEAFTGQGHVMFSFPIPAE